MATRPCGGRKDIHELQARLAALGGRHLGIILKIETRRAFDELPRLLLACMRTGRFGVMIARGDLAIECGYERMAEVQEEILWIAEAAHTPVIWATQVLESLAKTGVPSRAEVTDAAMAERAECVMLNKGPFIRQAVRTLDNILRADAGASDQETRHARPLNVAHAVSPGSRPDPRVTPPARSRPSGIAPPSRKKLAVECRSGESTTATCPMSRSGSVELSRFPPSRETRHRSPRPVAASWSRSLFLHLA